MERGRLIAVTRDPDAAGNWQFGSLPVRLGENRWIVRLYGPNGEASEQVFTRLIGTVNYGKNEVGYGFGVVDGVRPLLGDPLFATPAGPTALATVGWDVTSDMTARLDLRTGPEWCAGRGIVSGDGGARPGRDCHRWCANFRKWSSSTDRGGSGLAG